MFTLIEREVWCFFSCRRTPLAKGSLDQSRKVTEGGNALSDLLREETSHT
jgi:hypothetical protein